MKIVMRVPVCTLKGPPDFQDDGTRELVVATGGMMRDNAAVVESLGGSRQRADVQRVSAVFRSLVSCSLAVAGAGRRRAPWA